MATDPQSEYYDYRSPTGHTGPSPASPQHRYPGPGYDDGYDPPHNSRYDERTRYQDRGPPPRDPLSRQQRPPPHFDPPPRDPRAYPFQDHQDPRASYDQFPQQAPQYADYGSPSAGNQYPSNDRPYAPSEPRPNEGNQIAPYDEEKAEAEYRRGYYEQPQAFGYARPPPSAENDRYPRYNDERDRDRYQGDRDRYDSRYDNRRYDDLSDRDRDRQRRRYEPPLDEKVLRYPTQSQKRGGKDFFGGSEAERGLGATLAGAGGGALLGHEFAEGTLGTIGGAVAGALVAKVAENFAEKRKAEKELRRREAPYDRLKDQGLRDVPLAGGGYVEDRRYGNDVRYEPRGGRGGRDEYDRDEYARAARGEYGQNDCVQDFRGDARDVRAPSRRRRGIRSRDASWSGDDRR